MKNKIAVFFNKIRLFLFHKQKVKQVLISLGIIFSAFALLIPSGILHKTTPIYESSLYFSELIKKNDGKYIPVIAEQKDVTYKMNSTPTEYRGLYEAFETKQVNFIGTVNADKSEEIYLSDIEDCPTLSFLYVSVGFQNRKYEDHYLHESYNLELMFYGTATRTGEDYSFIYLSQSQADYLINKFEEIEIEDITSEDYENMIGKSVNLSIKGNIYSYTVGNIYLETNYFYEAIQDTIGDFILGYDFYPEDLKKQATFFMNSHEFQNKTYLEYSLNQYSPSKYTYKIGKANLNYDISDGRGLMFAKYSSDIATTFSIILAIVSFGLVGISFYLALRKNLFEQKANYIYFMLPPVIIYHLTLALFYIFKNIYVFPPFTSQMIAFLTIGIIVFYVIQHFVEKWNRGKV